MFADDAQRAAPAVQAVTQVERVAAERGQEVARGDTETSKGRAQLIVEWAGTYETVIYMMHVRNAGSEVVDLSGRALVAGTCAASGDAPLTLVRGSFRLEPGDVALIITHPDVPTDDRPRLEYANLYVRSGSTLTTRSGELRLVDPSGVGLGEPLGPIMADPAVGQCGIPAVEHCCFVHGGGPCGTGNPACWGLVTKSYCCNTLDACCWHASGFPGCAGGCPQSSSWQCCAGNTCP